MRVYLISYATAKFTEVQRELNLSALQWGIPNVLSYTDEDLHRTEYYQQNKEILDSICGAGYWAWKPYFILETLRQIRQEDVLFYCDAGSMLVGSPQPLVELCGANPQGLVLFDARPLRNRQFTKRDCFVRMGCDNPYFWDAPCVIATVLVVRKTDFGLALVQEWLSYCQDKPTISDAPNACGLPNLEGFLQHRHDQAILSVLAAKHRVETYRNPSHWGNFLKLPQHRMKKERVVSPYDLPPKVRSYSLTPQTNSPYGTVFVFNRQPNYEGKLPMPLPPSPSLVYRPSFFQKAKRFCRTRVFKKA